jgi:hypothetical protein
MNEVLAHTPQGVSGWQEESLTGGATAYVPLVSGQATGK